MYHRLRSRLYTDALHRVGSKSIRKDFMKVSTRISLLLVLGGALTFGCSSGQSPTAPPVQLTNPTLLTPVSGAVIPQNDSTIGCPFSADHGYGFAIEFTWSPVAGAAYYTGRVYHPGATQDAWGIGGVTPHFRLLVCNSYVIDANARDWRWTVAAVDSDDIGGLPSAEGTFEFGHYR